MEKESSLDRYLRQVNGLNYPWDLVYEGYGASDMVQDLNIANLKTGVILVYGHGTANLSNHKIISVHIKKSQLKGLLVPRASAYSPVVCKQHEAQI